MKKITLNQYIDAIAANGYSQGYGHIFCHDDDKTYLNDACAFGQAALNLGVDYRSLEEELSMIRSKAYTDIVDATIALNDDKKLDLPSIAVELKKQFKRLNRVITVEEKDYSNFTNWQGVKIT